MLTFVPGRTRDVLRATGGVIFLVGFSLLIGRATQDPLHIRYVVAAIAVIAFLGVGTKSPRLMLYGVVFWLTALGLTRRLVSEVGPVGHLDPLLLVGPLVLGLLVLAAAQRGALKLDTRLSQAVLVLSVLILLGAVNPLQGSLFGGIAGLLFVLVPTLGFWIGRSLDDRSIGFVFGSVAVLGVAAAAYGLLQTLSGFPAWDQKWIDQVTFTSLNVNGVIRPFATFSSAQEFAMYTVVAIVIWIGAVFRVRYVLLALGALVVLVPALVLESSRGAVVLVILALAVMLGSWLRLPLVLAAVLGALLLLALAFGLRSYGPNTFSSTRSGALTSHEVAGLSDPLNPQASTAAIHFSLVVNGIRSAFSNPVGTGIGSVTIAGATFGGVSASTESDASNVAVALGLPGLLAYLTVFVLGFRLVYKAARARRDLLAVIGLGIVTVTLFQWLNGGSYAVAGLPWLVLGWSDRRAMSSSEP